MSEYLWKKREAASEKNYVVDKVKKVLVLYTGGTIGMKWTTEGYIIEQDYLEQKVKSFPGLCDPDYQVDVENDWQDMADFKPIPLPRTFEGYRILYSILEYKPLQDSSNLSMEDWARIAEDVFNHYTQFNGFVILHGTDTMAYTASALSFMFENLGKTVILSGSQVPISELRNDARDNILGSLIMAGQFVIPEVCIFFHKKLYRGNRATKMASGDFEAFGSPNLPALATVGSDIIVEWDAVHRPVETTKFMVHSEMDRNVGILRIFPGITRATIQSFLQPPMEGVVMQTYGAGNIPDTDAMSYIFDELAQACKRGVVIVNCTQCNKGLVKEKYAAGIKLRAIGVVPGVDMTAEAALTKLSYLLASGHSREKVKELMSTNLRGELTVLDSVDHKLSLKSSVFLREVAHTLNITSSKEVQSLKKALFPPLMNAAAANGDVQCLQDLKVQGGDFNIPDYDGRTPLHLASCEGHLETVRYLLENGASVHVTDRYSQTPLDNAVRFGKKDVMNLLLLTGAESSHGAESINGLRSNGVLMNGHPEVNSN